MEDDPYFYTSSLTVGQETAMAFFPIFSGLLSVIGSSVIIFQVTCKSKRVTPYKRILFGLSSCDIVASLTYAIQPFFVPANSRRYWAIGNDTSCTILGALTQFAFSAVWYNGFLSYYYLATIRFKMDSKVFARRYEPIMHFLALGFNLLTAVSGALFHHYGEASIGAGCWVVGRCVNGYCITWPNGWVFAGFPIIFMFFSISVSNLVIYCHVRGQSKRRSSSHHGKLLQEDIKVQSVATQALGYVGSFFLCYTSCFVIKGIESFGGRSSAEAGLYPLMMLTSIVLPLFGFFNMVVFCRPSYIKFRSRFPRESRGLAIRHALLATDLSPIQHHGLVIASSMESGSHTSMGTGMDSSSFLEWNNSSRHTSPQRHVGKISSILFSVAEVGEESDCSDHAMDLNTEQLQPSMVDAIQEKLASEPCSDFEANRQAAGFVLDEEEYYDDAHSDDDSRMSSESSEDDFLRHPRQIYLEAKNKELEPRACLIQKRP
jgi:hypothetical protein